jgi:hypothetical protein
MFSVLEICSFWQSVSVKFYYDKFILFWTILFMFAELLHEDFVSYGANEFTSPIHSSVLLMSNMNPSQIYSIFCLFWVYWAARECGAVAELQCTIKVDHKREKTDHTATVHTIVLTPKCFLKFQSGPWPTQPKPLDPPLV